MWTFNCFWCFLFTFFFWLTQATFGISRLTGDPIRDPQVTTVPLPVRNIGGSVSTHRQKGKNRQATLTGSYFRSVGTPKRQPLFRECDCEPDCEVMGSRSFLAWVWTWYTTLLHSFGWLPLLMTHTKPRMHAWTTGSMDTGLYFMVKSEYPLEVEHGPGRLKHAGWWCSSHDENHQGLVSPLAVSSQVALFIFHSLQGPVPLNFLHFKNP